MWISNKAILILLLPVLFAIMIVSLIKRWSFSKTLASLIFALYAAIVILIVLLPFPIKLMPGEPCLNIPVNLIPFANIADAWRTHIGTEHQLYFFRLVIGNIVLFVPFGFLAPFVWKKIRETRIAIILFLAVPICLELVQYVNGIRIGSLYRSVDVDDVILNFLGAMLGYLTYRLLNRKRIKELH